MANIRLTPDELRNYAKKLRKNREESIALANSISRNINECANSWSGNQRDKYVAQFEDIKPTLSNKLPSLIQEMAVALDAIAQNFENADNA